MFWIVLRVNNYVKLLINHDLSQVKLLISEKYFYITTLTFSISSTAYDKEANTFRIDDD